MLMMDDYTPIASTHTALNTLTTRMALLHKNTYTHTLTMSIPFRKFCRDFRMTWLLCWVAAGGPRHWRAACSFTGYWRLVVCWLADRLVGRGWLVGLLADWLNWLIGRLPAAVYWLLTTDWLAARLMMAGFRARHAPARPTTPKPTLNAADGSEYFFFFSRYISSCAAESQFINFI